MTRVRGALWMIRHHGPRIWWHHRDVARDLVRECTQRDRLARRVRTAVRRGRPVEVERINREWTAWELQAERARRAALRAEDLEREGPR